MNIVRLAELQSSTGGGLSVLILQMAAIGLVFYFLILRPSGQSRKKHAELLAKLKKGDEVMTSGGIIGKVREIRETDTEGLKEVRVTIESGTASVVVERSRIVRIGNAVGPVLNTMSVLPLHLLGSPVLRQHSAEVRTVDDEVRRLVENMFETMDAARGVGLAANQVGVTRRVAVVDADGDRFVMIDPTIVEAEGRATAEEGCLSIPEIYGDISRPERVVLEALDEHGNRYRKEAVGLKARAIQHEIDHLDGILFLDHLSLIKRQMLLARWRREHKDDTGYIKEVQAASSRSE